MALAVGPGTLALKGVAKGGQELEEEQQGEVEQEVVIKKEKLFLSKWNFYSQKTFL